MSEIFRYAHVNAAGLVVNCSVWDGVTEYDPGEGVTMVQVSEGVVAGPGWSYVDGEFVAPPEPEEEDIPS